MMRRHFSPARWLRAYEAAGGVFLIVGAAAITLSPSPRAERMARKILADQRRWVAVFQLAAALGPAPRTYGARP